MLLSKGYTPLSDIEGEELSESMLPTGVSTLLALGASVRDTALWLYLSLAASSSNTICGKLRAYQFLNSGIAVYLPGLVKKKSCRSMILENYREREFSFDHEVQVTFHKSQLSYGSQT